MSDLDRNAASAGLLAVLDEAIQGATGDSTYFVDNRPGAGLLGALANLTATDASREVLGSSIAAHVHHVCFAIEASTDWIAGDRAPRDWSESWRVKSADDAAWSGLLKRLTDGYLKLRSAIRSDSLAEEDAFAEAVGATAHIAYHLGSIWQKRRALEDSSGPGAV